MTPRSALAGLLFCALTGAALAAAPPVAVDPGRLLPAGALAYVRWDGVMRHQRAYKRAAFGKALAEVLVRPARALRRRLEDDWKLEFVGDELLNGATPDALRRRYELVNAVLALPEVLAETGFAIALEAVVSPRHDITLADMVLVLSGEAGPEALLAPSARITAVFPGARRRPEVVALLKQAPAVLGALGAQAKRMRLRGRDVIYENGGVLFWLEGEHLVVVATSGGTVESCVQRVLNSGEGITGRPLYRALLNRRGFEVTTRGYIDGKALRGLCSWVRFLEPRLGEALEEFGVLDVEAVRFWEGFAGTASRSTWEVDVTKERHGVSRILVKKPLDWKSLPPIPADAYRWAAGRVNPDVPLDLLLAQAARYRPEANFARAKELARRELKEKLGFDPFREVFDALGDTFLMYASPTDGLGPVGQVVAVSVKDERKLARGIARFVRLLTARPKAGFEARMSKAHGAVIWEVRKRGALISFCYTIHKGWLFLAPHPQPLEGMLLRRAGKLPVWKPDRRTARTLAALPPGAGMVAVSGPRPVIQALLAAAPTFANWMDVSAADLPHAGAAARHLYPNVSWSSFDGKTWRLQSRGSLWLPTQQFGPEWLYVLNELR